MWGKWFIVLLMVQRYPTGTGAVIGRTTMMEECFYCGEQARRADIDRLGKCPSCMDQMTRAAEAAARESIGPNAQRMY
jgi:hypothetical protein